MNKQTINKLNKKFTAIKVLTKEQHDELVKRVNALRKQEERSLVLEKQKLFAEVAK